MESEHVYKVTEIVGASGSSIDEAVRHGLARASSTLRNLDWFEVTSIRGRIVNGTEPQFQVVIKIGFRLDE